MPTKISLKERVPAFQKQQERESKLRTPSIIPHRGLGGSQQATSHISGSYGKRAAFAATASNNTKSTRSRRSLIERTSVLRGSVRGIDAEEADPRIRLSSDDIRASPRLLFYLFSTMALTVLLVSITKFYHNSVQSYQELLHQRFGGATPTSDVNSTEYLLDSNVVLSAIQKTEAELDQFYIIYNGLVFRWKLWAGIYMTAIGCALNLFSFLFHFDTMLFPTVWTRVFRDGSPIEHYWLWFLVFYAALLIHVCTSTLSVGQSQANVYFTSWIYFFATVANVQVWRESAGRGLLLDKVRRKRRETTMDWIRTCFFSAIFAGAVTDITFSRNELILLYPLVGLKKYFEQWPVVLGIVWSELFVCLIVIAMNEFNDKSCKLPCHCQGGDVSVSCVFGWRQVEGLIILLSLAGKLYVILEFTGVDSMLNGLDNAYFGVWGSFFCSVFTLGAWLRERNNIPYLVRSDGGSSADLDDSETY